MAESVESSARAGRRAGRVTIVDVAHHAGVSVATASKVLRNAPGVSDAMRTRVRASMTALSYRPHRPARGMRGRTYTVGMIVSDIENPFFSLLQRGISKVIAQHNYEILIAPGGVTSSSQRAVMNALIDHQMDGVILVSPRASDDELDRIAGEIPMVLVGRHSSSAALDSISGDDELGAKLVVDHFVELGHERIAFVTHHNEAEHSSFPETIRMNGFRSAMAAHGLPATIIPAAWSLEGGRAAARHLATLTPQPTAVHAGADIAAFGMMSEIWERAVVPPNSFALAGYDNSPTSAIGPISLTTVDQSGLDMGSIAAEMLLERIAGRDDSRHELVTPSLVVRASSFLPTPIEQ
ncbi:LacI family DNA-binding transcriptional regulator [Microbacterium yannicii]|uniref:LacI family DNA-binding transcriptional regulator n=2 Tax=Microbacterium yannicii TaxID=671622 RepID=A0ABP9M371_9MICO|nr:LacI family DNA-binding transcriptional regulator [Microbacterium yannicii]